MQSTSFLKNLTYKQHYHLYTKQFNYSLHFVYWLPWYYKSSKYSPGYSTQLLVKAFGNDEIIFIYNNETLFEIWKMQRECKNNTLSEVNSSKNLELHAHTALMWHESHAHACLCTHCHAHFHLPNITGFGVHFQMKDCPLQSLQSMRPLHRNRIIKKC